MHIKQLKIFRRQIIRGLESILRSEQTDQQAIQGIHWPYEPELTFYESVRDGLQGLGNATNTPRLPEGIRIFSNEVDEIIQGVRSRLPPENHLQQMRTVRFVAEEYARPLFDIACTAVRCFDWGSYTGVRLYQDGVLEVIRQRNRECLYAELRRIAQLPLIASVLPERRESVLQASDTYLSMRAR